MRLVDADEQLEWVDCMAPIHGIGLEPLVAVETVRDLIKGAPTIPAIPVAWLKTQINEALDDNDTELASDIDWLIRRYINEQEAR